MSKDTPNMRSDDPSPVSQELLLLYVQDRVSMEERRRIEEQLTDDPFLADAVEGLMKLSGSQEAEKQLELIRQHIKEKSIPVVRQVFPIKRWMQLAAALIFLVAIGWFANSRLNESTERIFTEEFQPYPAPPNLSPPSEVADALLSLEEKSTSHSVPPEMQKQMQQNIPADASTKKLNKKELNSLEKAVGNSSLAEDRSVITTEPDVAAATANQEQSSATDSVNAVMSRSLTEVYVESHTEDTQLQEISTMAEEENVNQNAAVINDHQSAINEALRFYDLGEYAEAVVRFENILSKDPANTEAIFYAGVSYLALKQADKALIKLNQLDKNTTGSYYEQALWYQSLAFLQLEKKEDAIHTLKMITSLNGKYKERAEELLNTLK